MRKKDRIAGVILAGGQASRMGFEDKPLASYRGRPIIEHVIAAADPQVGELIISVNRNPAHYEYLGKPLISDVEKPFSGPLLGIYSAMRWLQTHRADSNYEYLACFAGDVPCFPHTIVGVLADALTTNQCSLAIAQANQQVQPLFSLWSLATAPILAKAISENLFGPKLVMPRIAHVVVTVNQDSPADFFNINTVADLAKVNSMSC